MVSNFDSTDYDQSWMEYKTIRTLDGLKAEDFVGFFEGWSTPPSAITLFRILSEAPYRAVAVSDDESKPIGFTYAVSDQILSAYIPLLEVLPEWRKHGIGSALVNDLLEQVSGLYMVDVCCDEDVISFYEKLAFKMAGAGLVRRNYHAQAGRAD